MQVIFLFYNVGEYLDSVFIYDTDDGSCELVKKSMLLGVDYVYKLADIPLYKLLTLLGAKNINRGIYINYSLESLSYTASKPKREYEVALTIRLCIIKKDYIIVDKCDFLGNLDYYTCIHIDKVLRHDGLYTGVFKTEDTSYLQLGWLLPVPPVMVLWLMRVFNMENGALFYSSIYKFIKESYYPNAESIGSTFNFYNLGWEDFKS